MAEQFTHTEIGFMSGLGHFKYSDGVLEIQCWDGSESVYRTANEDQKNLFLSQRKQNENAYRDDVQRLFRLV